MTNKPKIPSDPARDMQNKTFKSERHLALSDEYPSEPIRYCNCGQGRYGDCSCCTDEPADSGYGMALCCLAIVLALAGLACSLFPVIIK